jgi:drug/metabolite transporter (DMT)-like permease
VPYALLAYSGLVYAPAAHGGVFLNGCLPIFTTIFTWLWIGQRSRFSQIFGLGIILTGVILVGYEGFESSGGGMTWIGDFLFLAAIALFAVFMVANQVWSVDPGQIIFSVTIVSAVVYTPIWLLWLDSNLAAAPSSEILLQGAYQGLVPSILGISCLNIAVRHIGPRATSVFLSSVPVVAALTAIPILNELSVTIRKPRLPANKSIKNRGRVYTFDSSGQDMRKSLLPAQSGKGSGVALLSYAGQARLRRNFAGQALLR